MLYNAADQVTEMKNSCTCGFLISSYAYTYDEAGRIIGEKAVESLFTSQKDYGHVGGSTDICSHQEDNPWNNQNPEWETTLRTFVYDENGQLLQCQEDKGMFKKCTYQYEYDEVGNRTKATRQELFASLQWSEYRYNADNQMISATVCDGRLSNEYTYQYDGNGNLIQECVDNAQKGRYQYDTENRLKAVHDADKLLMSAAYDGDGNRTFQLNYNVEAVCGYGKEINGEVFLPEHLEKEDGRLSGAGEVWSYVDSCTGRTYDLTEYVHDINRRYTEMLMEERRNSGARDSYSYGMGRLSQNQIWEEARDVIRIL